jgi:hypothetical protein
MTLKEVNKQNINLIKFMCCFLFKYLLFDQFWKLNKNNLLLRIVIIVSHFLYIFTGIGFHFIRYHQIMYEHKII